jgi:hypothetical protein
MQNIGRFGLLLFIWAFSSIAPAQTNGPPSNWKLIGTASSGASTYLDLTSLAPEGNYKKIWSMDSYPSARPVPKAPGKTFISVTSLHWVDCPSHTFANPQKVYYDQAFGDGNSVFSYNIATVPFQDAVPGSVGAAIVQAACGGK